MVVSKKDMLFILWKLSEVRTQESACSSSALSPARYNESSESMIVRPSPTQSVRPRLTGLSSSAPHACAS